MYFPGDPLFAHDPIFNSVPRPAARRAAGRRVRPRRRPSRSGRWLPLGHRAARPRGATLEDGGRHERALAPTPSQTVGPFFAHRPALADGPYAVADGHAGRDLDRGAGRSTAPATPCPTPLIETWQADPDGRSARRSAAFARCCDRRRRPATRSCTAASPAPARPAAAQAPHLDVSVFARGLLDRVVTRIYFADEPQANAADPVLSGIGDERPGHAGRAAPTADGYRFDIHLQGDDETVFFAV